MKSKYYKSEHEIKPPYRVDGHDTFSIPGDEDGYWIAGHYESLDDAIQKGSEITLKSFTELGSLSKWRDMGIVGLVYDSQGFLVWRGDEIFDEPKS